MMMFWEVNGEIELYKISKYPNFTLFFVFYK